ncbi:MAG: TAXI family TRAP transporter solute-binding subunit [Alphaproteobacteria bacterium]
MTRTRSTGRPGGLLAAALLAVLLAAGAVALAQEPRFVTIGTAGVTGVYYPAGGAICRMVNPNRAEHGIRCSVESTGGSVFNLQALEAGDLDLALAQSDVAYRAVHGDGADFPAPAPDLRAVFSLHREPFTVLARADAGIAAFADLVGKRVNIGNPGSGQRATMDVIMQAMGWTLDDFAAVAELKSTDQARALCEGEIDASVFIVGHPSASVQEATAACDIVVVPVTGPEIDALVAAHPYYAAATIPGGMYRGNDADVPTFGMVAVLMTTARAGDDVIYAIVSAVFDNLDDFTRLHPALESLSAAAMARDGLVAPLHPGARRYFDEAGLSPE